MKAISLLTIDAIINLTLGLPLMLVPTYTARILGIPFPEPAFYASILGAVLTGIGIALLIERYHDRIHIACLATAGG